MRDLYFTWHCLTLLASVNCIIYLVKFYSILADMNSYFRKRLKEPFKPFIGKRCSCRANHNHWRTADIWLKGALEVTFSSRSQKAETGKNAPSSLENKWFQNCLFIHSFVCSISSEHLWARYGSRNWRYRDVLPGGVHTSRGVCL